MKTREQLEKDFDEKFSMICENMPILSGDGKLYELEDIKKHIFEQMIPKVLEEIIPPIERYAVDGDYLSGINNAIKYIKQNAKEKFGIDL